MYDIYDLDDVFIAGGFKTYHDATVYRNRLRLNNPIGYKIILTDRP